MPNKAQSLKELLEPSLPTISYKRPKKVLKTFFVCLLLDDQTSSIGEINTLPDVGRRIGGPFRVNILDDGTLAFDNRLQPEMGHWILVEEG